MRSRSMATRHRNNGSGPGEALIANTSVRENCSADRVSVHREVDRAYHDPGGFCCITPSERKCISDLARSALANGVAHSRIRVNSVHVSRIMHRRSATKSMVMSRVSPSPKFYVPRADLPDFLAQAVDLLRSNRTTVIYGTVRLIEKDDRAFLHGPKNPTPV
jgi:hypothetical protein